LHILRFSAAFDRAGQTVGLRLTAGQAEHPVRTTLGPKSNAQTAKPDWRSGIYGLGFLRDGCFGSDFADCAFLHQNFHNRQSSRAALASASSA
jgi:hypothetical protein